MKPVFYGIPEWSGKTFRARRTYVCNNCGGLIPSGVIYLRHVMRQGQTKGKDPLYNVHLHLDCQAPWYQPNDQTHRLRNLGLMREPTPHNESTPRSPRFAPAAFFQSKKIGTLQWTPSLLFASRLLQSDRGVPALAEIEHALGMLLTALTEASGNKRKAMRLNNLLAELTGLIDEVTPVHV